MNHFECPFCLYREITNKDKCSCNVCGKNMHILPYDRKEVLVNEAFEYVKLSEVELDEKFEFPEVKKMISEFKFPDYDKIYKKTLIVKDLRNYISFLNETVEALEKYLCNNFSVRRTLPFDVLDKKMVLFDEVLKDLSDNFHVPFRLPQITFPKVKTLLQYEKNKDFLEIIQSIINNLKLLIGKINKHVINYNLSFSDYISVNKFEFKDDTDTFVILENINKHLTKINTKELVFDFLQDGSNDFIKMNNAFWLSINTLLKYARPKTVISYVVENDKIDLLEEINKLFKERYQDFNDNIISKLNDMSIDQILDLHELFFGNNIKDKLNISNAAYLQTEKSEKKLKSLIGLNSIKETINKIKAYCISNKDSKDLNIHMCFLGNPGTGKTEVARLIAEILYENKILPTDNVIETDRSGLVSSYLGDTVNKTNEIIQSAMGGVLFIDEAYSLVSDFNEDYGHEAVAALIKAMEDYRGKFCVILAGYKNKMLKMLDSNPGFKSRIQFVLDFPDYSREEIKKIINILLQKKTYTMANNVKNKVLDIIDLKRKDTNFANAREARNIIEQLIMIQNLRTFGSNDKTITFDDVHKYVADYNIKLITKDNKNKKILTPEEELNELVGLSSIKKMIRKINAYAKKNKYNDSFNMHMCFYGNPGTGKTEVARIVSRLLYEAKVLPEAKLIETDKSGLIGKYIGHTESKTKELIESALGGVLFIDEAYGLNENYNNGEGYGKQAIEILLKEMEDNRGKFCVILAGYKKEMRELINMNPGFSSRIAFELEFPDFSREELIMICEKMITKNKYSCDLDVVNKIVDVTEYYKDNANFANARTLRNIIDKVIMNQNLRTENSVNNEIILEDVLEYITDENIELKDNLDDKNMEYILEDPIYNLIKTEIFSLSSLYQIMNKSNINQSYINEAIISISGEGSQGTGFIISPSGLCVTCNHCIINKGVNQKARIIMNSFDGKEIKLYSDFKVIACDEFNDIAIIKLMSYTMIYKYLPLANIDYMIKPLLKFYTAGYPFGGEAFEKVSFSEGQVASVNLYNNRKVVFSNMFGKPGSSGSPILDRETNEVIGIYWGGISSPDKQELINCFSPIDLILSLLKSI